MGCYVLGKVAFLVKDGAEQPVAATGTGTNYQGPYGVVAALNSAWPAPDKDGTVGAGPPPKTEPPIIFCLLPRAGTRWKVGSPAPQTLLFCNPLETLKIRVAQGSFCRRQIEQPLPFLTCIASHVINC